MISEAILTKIKPGATVRVFEKLQEGDKTQIRRFEGLILSRKHGSEPGASFTVRTTIAGVDVEKTFPLFSPSIDRVEVLSSPKKVKRSKLYFTRDLSRKALRRKTLVTKETESPEEKPAEEEKESAPIAE